MTDQRVEVEGASLEDALRRAAAELGIERRLVAFEYDRAHLAAGASTVKIIARPKDPAELEREAQAPRPPAEDRPLARERRPRSNDRDRGRPGGDRRDRGRDQRDRGGDRPRFQDGDRPRRPPPKKDPERDEALRQKARELAQRVLAGEGPLTIDDLNSYERHLVHTAVRELGGLVTASIGEGLRKNVQISRGE